MTDEAQTPAEVRQPEHNTDTQLEYPQLLIEASFESLLSHSHSSASRSVLKMPRSETSLSESWSSLSEHDLSHDDDLQSDVTDTGSLIDVSQAEDVHSVDEYGHSSETEEDNHEENEDQDDRDDEYNSLIDERRYAAQGYQSEYSAPHSSEGIRHDSSTIIVDDNGSPSLQASKMSTELGMQSISSRYSHADSANSVSSILRMPVAPEGFKPDQQRPYHILYYGSTLSSPEIKSEILSKVGAALINSSDSHSFDSDTESPCYHVVPSEFGPGSKPRTADLIPIPTQMHVSECTVSDNISENKYYPIIRLHFSNGKDIVSRRAKFTDSPSQLLWNRPDLVVVVVSKNESVEDRSKALKVLEFANRHHIPAFCLRQETGWDSEDDDLLASTDLIALHKLVYVGSHSDQSEHHEELLDVDTFLALDIEMFSRHLSYITASTKLSNETCTKFTSRALSQFEIILQDFTRLLPPRLARVLDKDAKSWQSQLWVAEVQNSQVLHSQSQRQKERVSKMLWETNGWNFVLTTLVQTLMAMIVTGAVVYVFSNLPPAPRTLSAGQHGVVVPPCSTSVVPSPVTGTTTTSTQTYALSGPLQMLEQQVQSLIPVRKPRTKREVQQQPLKPVTGDAHGLVVKACHNVVPAYLFPNLKVDAAFFVSGQPAFGVRVHRNGENVGAKIEKQANGMAMIMVKRRELYGQLTVHLDGLKEQTCAFVDLENSVGEALTHWIESRQTNHKLRTTNRIANEYTRLLEVRTRKPGLVSSAVELQYSATQKIGAAVEAMERSAIKHVRGCHEDRSKCFKLSRPDVMGPAQHARRVSEQLFQNTCQHISDRTKQAKDRVNDVTEQVQEEISKAVQIVQSSIGELSVFRRTWPIKVTENLAEAQRRAKMLAKKSRSRRKESSKSA